MAELVHMISVFTCRKKYKTVYSPVLNTFTIINDHVLKQDVFSLIMFLNFTRKNTKSCFQLKL